MEKIIKAAGRITGIYTERLFLDIGFLELASYFTNMSGTVILMSGGNLDCARYHILAVKPWMTLKGFRNNVVINIGDQKFEYQADPFDMLSYLMKNFKLDDFNKNTDFKIPVPAGLFGYFSYDLKDCLEKLPRTSVDDLILPYICFFAPSIIVVHDKIENNTTLCIPEQSISKMGAAGNLDVFKKIISSPLPGKKSFSGGAEGFRSDISKPAYLNSIKKIREYIAAGDVYQVNFSRRFVMDFKGDPFSLFQTLYDINPAPFFSFINAGNHHIISTSPERFLKQTGTNVETRPIKGTRPRGKTGHEDNELKNELKTSGKDDAELSMIVDLLRNDLGRVCREGSVQVKEHKRMETYTNVYHLVSIVEGVLKNDVDSVDLLKATFPGGSITGCPKIRAMEIIDELEPNRRHIYTGSIGYLGFNDTLDFSIAIRTATIYNQKIIYSVGGGIVFDSDPLEEYYETIHKGRSFEDVFKRKGDISGEKSYIWKNGKIEFANSATIPVFDQGFLFGYGFFETVRVGRGKPLFLNEHIARFNKTWKRLFGSKPPDLTWDDIIRQVITKNDLSDNTAAVKILATRGDRMRPPCNHTLLVSARTYIHRLEGKKDQGINLVTYNNSRQSPLADYKTLNYLYYLMAGEWARARGADEALILNPDGTVSETNTANIMLIRNKTVVIPASAHLLPGIMQNIIVKILGGWGFSFEYEKIRPEFFFSNNEIIISNSLIGTLPVLSLDGKRLKKPSNLWLAINEEIPSFKPSQNNSMVVGN